MRRYKLWIQISASETLFTLVYAEHDYAARQLGEAQYGMGNVLGVWQED